MRPFILPFKSLLCASASLDPALLFFDTSYAISLKSSLLSRSLASLSLNAFCQQRSTRVERLSRDSSIRMYCYIRCVLGSLAATEFETALALFFRGDEKGWRQIGGGERRQNQ